MSQVFLLTNAECRVPEIGSSENKERFKNWVLCREMGSAKGQKEFWRDSIMVKLEKKNTGGENESCKVGAEMLERERT